MHLLSEDDRAFLTLFESLSVPPADFDHRAHLRLAYIYLVGNDVEEAQELTRNALLRFLEYIGVGASKYHDTITRAWILAVRHFMNSTPQSDSADDFIDQNSTMLDPKIMMTHYSAELLFSDEARVRFVEPDLDAIPRHD